MVKSSEFISINCDNVFVKGKVGSCSRKSMLSVCFRSQIVSPAPSAFPLSADAFPIRPIDVAHISTTSLSMNTARSKAWALK